MNSKRIKIRQAARIAGVSASTISDWRSGRAPTDFFAVKRLSEVFGTSLCYLLTGLEENSTALKTGLPAGSPSNLVSKTKPQLQINLRRNADE